LTLWFDQANFSRGVSQLHSKPMLPKMFFSADLPVLCNDFGIPVFIPIEQGEACL